MCCIADPTYGGICLCDSDGGTTMTTYRFTAAEWTTLATETWSSAGANYWTAVNGGLGTLQVTTNDPSTATLYMDALGCTGS